MRVPTRSFPSGSKRETIIGKRGDDLDNHEDVLHALKLGKVVVSEDGTRTLIIAEPIVEGPLKKLTWSKDRKRALCRRFKRTIHPDGTRTDVPLRSVYRRRSCPNTEI